MKIVAVQMMRGIAETLSNHHHVRILNEAVVDSVHLSSRYISGRQLPDKSVSLLDTACARIGLSQAGTPAPVEDCERNIEQLKVAIRMLEKETKTGRDHSDELVRLNEELTTAEAELISLKERWIKEKELVVKINELHSEVHAGLDSVNDKTDQAEKIKSSIELLKKDAAEGSDKEIEKLEKQLAELEAAIKTEIEESPATEQVIELNQLKQELTSLQGESPLVHAEVNSQAIAETVSVLDRNSARSHGRGRIENDA